MTLHMNNIAEATEQANTTLKDAVAKIHEKFRKEREELLSQREDLKVREIMKKAELPPV